MIRECPLLALSAPLLASNDVALGTKRTWTDVRLESAFRRIADAGLVRDVPGFGGTTAVAFQGRDAALLKAGVLMLSVPRVYDDLSQIAWFHILRPTENKKPVPMRCLAAIFFSLATVSFAVADPGDAEKAKEMLARVVVVVQRDENAAMQMFSAGTDGFRDGNIYPFCFRLSDGVVITGQTAGSDIRTFPGSGPQIFEAAQKPEGETTEIGYLAKKPPPAEVTPVNKVSVVRRIGQIGCGVGYYP